ncbi:Potassium-dependent sodium-calcium exchanger [Gryllus bimaculatus]|nr:Potassium-dependent sodium-calcium exchanger [Gryllus bimaculatus]
MVFSLGVRSLCAEQSRALCARAQVVPLDWWPLTRDCLAYGVTVALMICIIHDERVEWYEALTLVLLYIVYIAGDRKEDGSAFAK